MTTEILSVVIVVAGGLGAWVGANTRAYVRETRHPRPGDIMDFLDRDRL